MKCRGYRSLELGDGLDRRDFLKLGGTAGVTLWLGGRSLSLSPSSPLPLLPDPKPHRRGAQSPQDEVLPSGFVPGKVVEVNDVGAVREAKPVPSVVGKMFENGLKELTGQSGRAAFGLFFSRDDIVGIKVNPVGPGTISTHHEVVEPLIHWLTSGGLPRRNIIIWTASTTCSKTRASRPRDTRASGSKGSRR